VKSFRKLIRFASSQRSVAANVSGVSPSRPTMMSAITWMPRARSFSMSSPKRLGRLKLLPTDARLSSERLSKPIDSTRAPERATRSSSSGSRATLIVAWLTHSTRSGMSRRKSSFASSGRAIGLSSRKRRRRPPKARSACTSAITSSTGRVR
jgi:hypothetical protein